MAKAKQLTLFECCSGTSGQTRNTTSGSTSPTTTTTTTTSTTSTWPTGTTINTSYTTESLSLTGPSGNDHDPNMSATSTTSTGIIQVPSDIAQGLEEEPVQPHNISFPKENGRAFNSTWYSKHTWLEYSVSNDSVYCYPCRFFSSSIHKSDECFVSTGYRNWKKATGMTGRLRKHTLSHRHVDAVAAWSDYLHTQRTQTSVASALSQVRREQVKHNRHYLKTIIEVLMYCANHEIALRGHREGESSGNRGNFLDLLDMISKHDPIVMTKLQHGPRNATYTSHGIHDDLLMILGNNVVKIICNKIRNAGYYSIIVDESRDVSKQEQMTFVVRFLDVSSSSVHEHFLTFIHAEKLDAESLSSYIKQLISTYDLDPNKMVSQGYDGANVMRGHCTGVQTRVKEFAPFATYIHCYAHILNLVLVDSVKSVAFASEFFILLEALYVFVSSSKMHVIFMEKQRLCRPQQQPLELQKLSDTRWVCRHAAVNAICRTYDSLIHTIEEVADSPVSQYTQSIEARGLLHQVKSFSFLLSLITFDRILTCTKQLSDNLQTRSIDLSRATELVLSTVGLLTEYRSDSYWDKVYSQATRIAQLHNITTEFSEVPRRRRIPTRLNDSFVFETVGQRLVEASSSKEEFKTQLYYPVLDQFLCELKRRFQDQNVSVLKGISACTPNSSNFLSVADLKSFSDMYGIQVDENDLTVEVELVKRLPDMSSMDSLISFRRYLYSFNPAYTTLRQLTQIALTIAVTSSEAERSFSTLKRIKTRLRSTMGQERLSTLSVLSIEREIANQIDYDSIIDIFASSDKNRRIVLS